MVNINLTTSTEEVKQKSFFQKRGVIYIGIVIIVWIAIFAGLYFFEMSLKSKQAALDSEKAQKEEAIKSGSNKDIFDFQTRLTTAKSLLEKKSSALESLNKIQEAMVGGAKLVSYEYDAEKNTLILMGESDNYGNAASQIASFKKSDYFTNVQITETKNTKGKIAFTVKMSIK